MDLTKKSTLTQEERFEIAALMHGLVVGELFRITDWKSGDAIFHGGTSLALIRASERFSEDLDFMISEESAADLDKVMRAVEKRVAMTMDIHYRGSRIELRGPKGEEVKSWSYVWSNPARHGVVQVKTEFMVTTAALLADYASTHVVPMMRRPIVLRSQIPVPQFVSAWADKVKAMATRPAFKWRDAYDLSYISQCMARENVNDVSRSAAIKATAAIYSKTMADVEAGLVRILDEGYLEDVASYETDMGRWFDKETFKARQVRGMFEDDLETAKFEIEGAIRLINRAQVFRKPLR